MNEIRARTVEDFLPKLEKALAYAGDTHDPHDVAEAILERRARLFVKGEGLVVTEVEQYPKLRIARVWLAAGALDDVLGLWPLVEQWARAEGCDRIVTLGRKGWEKPLKRLGWERHLVEYRKDL